MSMKIDTPSFKNKTKTCWPEFPHSGQHVFTLLFILHDLERVWKIISAICKPHFAGDFTLIRLP